MPDRFEALERRLTALEERLVEHPPATPDGPLWILEGLRARTAETTGGVAYAGVWHPEESEESGGTPVAEWQYGLPVDDLLERDWAVVASPLMALGHPVRLEVLKRVLRGTTATRDLAETEGFGTSGQLHHHLRVLVGAGWLRQRQRGDYEVPTSRIIPLLAIITATSSG